MKPDEALKYLNGAMSLRDPQYKSLELFADYLQSHVGQKLLARMKKETRGNLAEILQESKDYFVNIPEARNFQDFERSFPAYTFALATGVGKTRGGLMAISRFLKKNPTKSVIIVVPSEPIQRQWNRR